ncbi:MAG: Gfo/Idh/MocA family oxidoreductase [Bacteroidota bacterium]
MTKPIQTGLASYGLSGQVFHAPFLESNPGYTLKKVWERTKRLSNHRYPHVEVVRQFEEMLDDQDIELVIVNTPDYTHYDLCKKALEAGKHVIVEKPFTLKASDGEKLIELAKSRNRVLSVYQNCRWHGDFLTMQEVLDQELLGQVVEFEAHFDRFQQEVDKTQWREQASLSRGLIYDLGAHIIDQALVLFGLPDSVVADLRVQRPGGEVNDYFDVRLKYPDTVVTLKGGLLVRETGPRYVIHGTEGSFLKYGIDPQEKDLANGYLPEGPDWGKEDEADWGILNTRLNGLHYYGNIESFPGNYHGYFNSIYRAIRLGENPAVKPEEGVNVIRIIEAAIQSSEVNKAIIW